VRASPKTGLFVLICRSLLLRHSEGNEAISSVISYSMCGPRPLHRRRNINLIEKGVAMTLRPKVLLIAQISLVMVCVLGSKASASVIPITQVSFPPSSTLLNFTGLADGTEVNGLVVNGVSFAYSLGNGAVVIDGGPGVTNNISPPNIVSIGNNTGTLTITLPAPANLFGYGYAILTFGAVPNATTISLFSGATPVGSLSYAGALDPIFTGGFAGIQSTILFDRIQINFNSAAAPAFALDNVQFTNTTVPEPMTMLLLGAGLAAVALKIRKRRQVEKE